MNKKIRVFDIEANSLLDEVSEIHCAVFSSLDGKEVDKFGPDQMDQMIAFMDTCDVLIGHNVIGYDFPALEKVLGYKYKGTKVDTLLMSRLLNPNRMLPPHAKDRSAGPHSLYAWGVRVGIDKPEHHDWDNYSPEMLHRCSEDVSINVKTYHALMKEAKDSGGGWGNAFKLTFKFFENIHKQEEYGWKFDTDKARETIRLIDHWINRIDKIVKPDLPDVLEIEESKLKGEVGYVKKPFTKAGKYAAITERWYESTGLSPEDVQVVGPFSRVSFRKVNLDSNMELKDYLLSLGWNPKDWNLDEEGNRRSPKLSLDDPFDGLEGIVGQLIAKRVQCRHRRSNIEGLIDRVRPDGSIPGSVSGIAVTGRCMHRNIVNIPGVGSFLGKRMRSLFIAREGKILVSTDSAGNQLRQLAGRMGDDAYIDAVVNGDIHSVNQEKAGLATRAQAKTFIYGLLFGAGDAKVGKIVKGTSADGKRLKEKFFDGLPALKDLLDKLTAEWRSNAKQRYNPKFGRMEYHNGWIRGLDGRPIRISSEHQILVYMLQSDEAIQMQAAFNLALSKLEKRYERGVDFEAVGHYHDEFSIECDPEIAEEVRRVSEWAIAQAGRFFNIKCPHAGQGKIGKSWADIH